VGITEPTACELADQRLANRASDATVAEAAVKARPARRARRSSRSRRFGTLRALAVMWLASVVGLALLAPILPIPDPTEGGHGVGLPPFGEYFLGTDQLGRDMFSRVVFGARMSLLTVVLSVGMSMIVGLTIGLVVGYVKGKADTVAVATSDVILAFPDLILLMVISVLAAPSVRNLILAIAVFQLPTFIRLGRANTLKISQREFVMASEGLGARRFRVMTREILPNVLPSVTAYALATSGVVLMIEGSLSFLGLGIAPPTPVWGSMIAAGRPFLTTSPHIVVIPGLALFLTVLSFNALADAARHDVRPQRLSG
jgi:peptide/nickel transport system permease protein